MNKAIKISETDHQKTVIEWAAWNEKKYPPLKFLYACPNEGKHKVQYRVHQKAMGLKAGVPDLFLPFPIAPQIRLYDESGYVVDNAIAWPGLYIEMKTKGGSVKPKQKEWIAYLKEQGYKVEVCWTADEAIQTLETYLNNAELPTLRTE